ncbi:Rieske (2Fe-2S) protein [Pseudomonas umsongensis]|uniref:Rieske (2Fe-2S) protein n=1 Tax=Pseudomonas umsongensis TaxID=198618 RepID=UPI00200A137A|nr:Rieske (2Fe-2S) protein [Pseudomonas umsongensis]MCK8683323.1 Rieske (2Fe-2S) protein [Pseudomonas umsongensis]
MNTAREVATDAPYIDVMAAADLPPGTQCVHVIGTRRVLLCHPQGQGIFAVSDMCPHARQPLSGGTMNGSSITCLKHGARFDLGNGQPLNGVCKKALQTFEIRIRDERIEVFLPVAP